MTGEATKRRSDGATKGFTLVEMVIVIGIIILLAALTLSVSVAVVEGSEVRQTENTIRLLTAALQEWEAQADRRVTYGKPNEPSNPFVQPVYEVNQEWDEHRSTAWLFRIVGRPTSVKQILAQVDPEFVEQGVVQDEAGNDVDALVFRDAWGNPIVAVFPGRTWVLDQYHDDQSVYGNRDADGTIRTRVERVCGGTANRQICFVSAGPDGEFGDLSSPDPDVIDEAGDNVYSYEPAEITAP